MRSGRIHSPSNAQRLLYSSEARVTAFESGLKMWDVCVHGTPVRVCRRVNISRDTGSTVGKPCDQPASIVTLPTQTNAWTGAKVPARRSASPAVCSPFFPPSTFLFLPSPPSLNSASSLLFSLFPFTLLSSPSPVCCSSSFSHLLPPTAPTPLLAALSCSTCLPCQQGPVSHFCLPEEI